MFFVQCGFDLILLLFRVLDKMNFSMFLNGIILYEQSLPMTSVCFLSVVSGPIMLMFLPWRLSEFSNRSGGMPNLRMYRIIMYSEVAISTVRFISISASMERYSSAQISILLSFIGLLFASTHIFVKLRALSIQQYDVEIREKTKNNLLNYDMESLRDTVNATDLDVDSNNLPKKNELDDYASYVETLRQSRASIEELRLSNRLRASNRMSSFAIITPRSSSIVDKRNEIGMKYQLSQSLYPDENINVLRSQLAMHNIKPLEYIPLKEIKRRIAELTNAVNRGDAFDENELDHLLKCMEVNEEYIRETIEQERIWREKILSYSQECLKEQRKFISPDIFVSSLKQLIENKSIPAALAKRLINKKCLWLIRMDPSYICKLHYAELNSKFSVQGNNLDIVETLAIYACVPAKFPNDTNGKKALWRNNLEVSVKRLISSKENCTLSSALLRNPAYKNYTGSFTSEELFDPETLKSIDEDLASRSNSRSASTSVDSYSVSRTASVDSGVQSPLHEVLASGSPLASSNKLMISEITPLGAEAKLSIKSQLQHVLNGGSSRERNKG